MVLGILTFVVKRQGHGVRYKSLFRTTLRQYANHPKKVLKPKAKVLASAAVARASSLREDIAPERHVPKSPPKVIGKRLKKHEEETEPVIGTQCKTGTRASDLDCNAKIQGSPVPRGEGIAFKTPVIEIAEELKEQPKVTLLNAVKPIDLDWHKQIIDLKSLPRNYMKLAKIRLTGLVVLTTAAGYGMAVAPMDPSVFLYTLVGTGLMSAAANTMNQFLEVPYDSQMSRTKNRVLVRGLLTPVHAVTFAGISASLGFSLLCFGANGLTAVLGATNLLLYTAVYTPLKRCSILNTWVGSVVGAIPPLMGWAACSGCLDASGLLIGAILYSWQFPHFNALSWNLRPDYSRAGYRMMSVVNPSLCQRTALRHSVAILLFCSAAPLVGLTTWTFAVDSLPLNLYLIYFAYKFYKNADSQSSRQLFRLSLVHLPVLMLLMFVGKKYSHKEEDNQPKVST